MKTILAISIMSVVATGAFAKGHDQGSTAVPGTTVGATVSAAHTLGGSQGKRPAGKGPINSPAVTNAGK